MEHVYKRFARWSELGVWQRMFEHFASDPDMESLMIDSTVVRAHACWCALRKMGIRLESACATSDTVRHFS